MADSEKSFIQQFVHVVRAIPPGKMVVFGITLAMVLGSFIALLIWANRPDLQVLFTKLDATDAAHITERLQERKIPFQLKEGGSAILVPDDMVYQLRLDLAGEGIPQGQNVGFEIFQDTSFGMTEFEQKMKYQRAIQGELARTIIQFDAVSEARVHIVASGDSLFAEPERPATASVVLRLQPGRSLNHQQLQGIINLVARAVKGLKPENVTLVDMTGGLLSGGNDADGTESLSRAQFAHRQKLERSMENRIRTMLESIVGMNRVVARVSADVDFEQVNILEESYDPDSSVIRSEQRQKESTTASDYSASGSPDLQFQATRDQGGGAGSSDTFKKENAVINYEINKINKQITNSIGDIKRLSVAVIIDGPYVTENGPDGNSLQKFTPRDRREMKTFEDIVKKAIGFSEARGDQVSVSNISFAFQPEEAALQDRGVPWMDYARKATRPLFNVLLVVLFFLFAVRPFKKWLNKAGDTFFVSALAQGDHVPQLPEEAGSGSNRSHENRQRLDAAGSNPDAAAQVIKGWLSEGR